MFLSIMIKFLVMLSFFFFFFPLRYSTNIVLPNDKQCLLLEDIRSTFPIDIYPYGISVIQLENLLKYKLNMSKYLARKDSHLY
jgi:hypothetical protein